LTAQLHHRPVAATRSSKGELANSAETFIANDCLLQKPPPAAHHRPQHGR
jgi:hypothetical protein